MPRAERTSGRIGVVIVEDEERARRTLADLVLADSELHLLGETAGSAAPQVIRNLQPELMLLDVQMPGLDGFGVLRALELTRVPVVIFVTAYDRYALDAFEFAAMDYLLKPFSDSRFATAIARAKEQVRLRRGAGGDADDRLARLLERVTRRPSDRLLLRDGSRTLLVSPTEIDWVQADGVYVRLHAGKRNTLVRESLTAMEARLAGYGFFRIHRSALVNLSRVVELTHRSHGDYSVRLRDGTELTLARTRKDALEEQLAADR